MSLSEQIDQQYAKRSSKAHLYHQSDYITNSQEEIRIQIDSFLSGYFKDRGSLTLLEIGAGSGGNAYMFQKLGLSLENISFNELLPQRIEMIKQNFPVNRLYPGDAIQIDFDQQFDIVFQSTVFTSILDNQARQDLAKKMWDLLKPGGIILWYDFIYNNPGNPDVRKVSVSEVEQLFENAIKMEVAKVTLAPPIGRKVGKFYKLFNFKFLRSHILAVFQKGNK